MKLLISALALLAVIGTATAAPDVPSVQPITLTETLTAALIRNPAIQSALSNAEAAAHRASQQRGTLLPEARIQGYVGTKRQNESPNDRVQHIRSQELIITQPLTVTQEYVDWQAQKAIADAELARAQQTIQQTLLNTATAYADLLTAQDTISATTALVANLERQKTATHRQLQQGESTKTAVAQVASRLATAKADLARFVQQRDASLAQLQSLAAMPIAPDAPRWHHPPEVTKATEQQSTNSNPSVYEAEARLRAADYRRKSAATEIFPEVTLNASRGHQSGDPQVNDAWASKVTINYSVPLFRGGRTIHAIAAADADHDAAAQSLQWAEYQARREWASAIAALDANKDALKNASAGAAQQNIAITGARLEYVNGERSLSDLLNAEQEYVQSEISVARARRDLIVATYRLRAAQGELIIP